jgi:hypothetical protein
MAIDETYQGNFRDWYEKNKLLENGAALVSAVPVGGVPGDPNPTVVKSEIAYESGSVDLLDGESIDSGWIDYGDCDKYQFSGFAPVSGMTFITESSDIDTSTIQISTSDPTESAFFLFNAGARQRYIRIVWKNETGVTQNGCSITIKKTFGSSDKATSFPINVAPTPFTPAPLTQSIIRGVDEKGGFQKVAVNTAGALLQGDFGTEVARGVFTEYHINTKFGRNSDIDTASPSEDVWNGGGLYTGFNCTSSEQLEVFSSDVDDVGILLSNGTATAGSDTTIEDSGATFIADGVVIGDIVINDTEKIHGVILSVDSETKLTVLDMRDGTAILGVNNVGDSYRIATSSSTGAAVVKLDSLLDDDYNSHSEYIILNGVTPVLTTGSYCRHSRGKIISSGSSDTNEGEITARQSTTTANVTMVMPSNSGQSAICCDTVPKGKTWIIKRLHIGMGRASGAAGSANVRFQIRERGGAWQTKRFPIITDGLSFTEEDEGGIVVLEESDVKWNIEDVSDNNTIVSAEFEYYEINN